MEKTRFIELLSQWDALRSTNVQELQQLSEQYPWFQALNLIMLKRLHMEKHPSFQDTLEQTSISIPDRSMLYNLLFQDKGLQKPLITVSQEPEIIHKTEEAHHDTLESSDNQDKGELIEKFIEAEPRIVPKEGDFAEAVAIAKKSNILYLDVVTETLAEVYLQQGNKSKARKIFEKLSLTIPEKSSYFAARIEELRK